MFYSGSICGGGIVLCEQMCGPKDKSKIIEQTNIMFKMPHCPLCSFVLLFSAPRNLYQVPDFCNCRENKCPLTPLCQSFSSTDLDQSWLPRPLDSLINIAQSFLNQLGYVKSLLQLGCRGRFFEKHCAIITKLGFVKSPLYKYRARPVAS